MDFDYERDIGFFRGDNFDRGLSDEANRRVQTFTKERTDRVLAELQEMDERRTQNQRQKLMLKQQRLNFQNSAEETRKRKDSLLLADEVTESLDEVTELSKSDPIAAQAKLGRFQRKYSGPLSRVPAFQLQLQGAAQEVASDRSTFDKRRQQDLEFATNYFMKGGDPEAVYEFVGSLPEEEQERIMSRAQVFAGLDKQNYETQRVRERQEALTAKNISELDDIIKFANTGLKLEEDSSGVKLAKGIDLDYDKPSMDRLRREAKYLKIPGYKTMSGDELAEKVVVEASKARSALLSTASGVSILGSTMLDGLD